MYFKLHYGNDPQDFIPTLFQNRTYLFEVPENEIPNQADVTKFLEELGWIKTGSIPIMFHMWNMFKGHPVTQKPKYQGHQIWGITFKNISCRHRTVFL